MKKKTMIYTFVFTLMLVFGLYYAPLNSTTQELKAQDGGHWCLDFSPIGEPCSGIPLDCWCAEVIIIEG